MKTLTVIVSTLVCIILGTLPELAMWALWGLVHPQTEVGRILMIALFIFCGGGISIFALFGAISLWCFVVGVTYDR